MPLSTSCLMTTARPFLMFQGGSARAALDLYFATFPVSRMVRVSTTLKASPVRLASSRSG